MICPLCQKEKKLIRSHIIPEFMYEPLYDDLHRCHKVIIDNSIESDLQQKGLRENLLCQKCDAQIGTYEDYVAKFLKGGVELIVQKKPGKFIIKNIDYKKFKLFVLSLLYRMELSKDEMFRAIKLGPHFDKIQSMLREEKPGEPFTYGSIVACFYDKGELVTNIITQPRSVKFEGIRAYIMVMGGLTWIFFVSNHNKMFTMKHLFLGYHGEFIIHQQGIDMDKHISNMLAQHFSGGNKKY